MCGDSVMRYFSHIYAICNPFRDICEVTAISLFISQIWFQKKLQPLVIFSKKWLMKMIFPQINKIFKNFESYSGFRVSGSCVSVFIKHA